MADKDKRQDLSKDIIESSMLDKIPVDEIIYLSNNESAYEKFKLQHPEDAHRLLLISLTNEEFDEPQAIQHWKNILEHRNSLNQELGRDVGVAVASLDYLTNIVDVLTDPVLIEEDKSQNISEIATNDRLTGLVTRDIFDILLKKEVSQASRTGMDISLAMIDIDDFKEINDHYGHQQGDKVLSSVGAIVRNNVRKMDTAARYGGEELVILMPNTSAKTASEVAERIRKDIENMRVSQISITVSIGVSDTRSIGTNLDELVKKADQALYQAKRTGKNIVVRAG
jgi:diguanylate cyclase (GGDEF)-like protein